MGFEFKSEAFSGPLHLLLELIEAEELSITEVSLARVADDYLEYVNAQEVPPEELADFLVVASRLLYIKSKAILPDVDFEEEEEGNLAEQLKMYRKFVEASAKLYAVYQNKEVSFARSKPLKVAKTEFAPPQKLEASAFSEAMRSVIKRLEPFLALKEASMRKVVSVQDRIRNIHDVLINRAHLSFSEISSGGNKVDVVVNFLALLELMKQRVISVAQSDAFSDITIKRVE